MFRKRKSYNLPLSNVFGNGFSNGPMSALNAEADAKHRAKRSRKGSKKFSMLGKPINSIPPMCECTFKSSACVTHTVATSAGGYFDVCLSDLHLPWVQTAAVISAAAGGVRTATMGTPTNATNGFMGLVDSLGPAGWYETYIVKNYNISVRVQSELATDQGVVAVVLWRNYKGTTDVVPTTIDTARDQRGTVFKVFNNVKQGKITLKGNIATPFGITESELLSAFSSTYGAAPTSLLYARVIYATADDVTSTGAINIQVDIKPKCKLFNRYAVVASTVV